MKKIKLEGKLNLNKETISTLDNNQMEELKGGALTRNNTLSLGRRCTQEINGCNINEETQGVFCAEQ